VAVALLVACGEDAASRRERVSDLSRDPTEENVARLRSLVGDLDRDVRATALDALVGLAVPDASDLVRTGLADEDPFVRATAAKLAADVGDASVTALLARVLAQDPEAIPRQRSAEALTSLGGETAIEALAGTLDDPVEDVRLAAVRGVEALGPDRARDDLGRLLSGDSSWEIRSVAARALGRASDAEAVVGYLESALSDPNEYVRAAAAQALSAHGRPVPAAARSAS
jgi:HEAT repeat protein